MISWFQDMLALSLSITPIILLLLWLEPLLNKRYLARWRYILWMVVSIRMLLPVSLASYVPLPFQISAPVASQPTPSAMIGSQLSGSGLPEAGISWVQILFILYLTGTLAYLSYHIFIYLGFRRDVLRWSRKSSDQRIEKLLTEQKTKLNIKRDISASISKKVSSPMMVGLVRTRLLLPADTFSDNELRMILMHELVHVKRHDIWLKVILMLTAAMHWFNPAVHLMVREANRNMEKSCDDYVLQDADVNDKKTYCSILLKIAIHNNYDAVPVFSTNISSSKHDLESRIKGVFETKAKKRGIAALTAIAALVIISGVLVDFSSAESNRIAGNEYANSRINADNEMVDFIAADEVNSLEQGEPVTSSDGDDRQDSSDMENSQQYHASQPAEIPPINDNRAEVVVVDINQLEEALEEDEPAGESER